MKYLSALLLAFAVPSAFGIVFPVQPHQQHAFAAAGVESAPTEELRLVQVSPTETRWVTEQQKLELKKNKINFMDITDNQSLGESQFIRPFKKIEYPDKPQFQDKVNTVLKTLRKENMRANLEKFTSFHTRYYKSDYGKQSGDWLFQRVQTTLPEDHQTEFDVKQFAHRWQQSSLIARIPGRTNKTVVIGAHQDSINLFLPSFLAAPGADDDGSGTVTILESFRAITNSDLMKDGLENTLEFHWYSAEEGGLLGSQDIFRSYERDGREVVAMLQQDMTGFIQKTLDAGLPESVGVITDFVSKPLTDFIKKIIEEYCDIPYVETECGYACSDHASASKAGYPSAFVIESSFDKSDDHIHTTEDKIEYLSFDHMIQHAKLTVGLALELALHKFD
ncbi:Zn-dependent exopeptidase [Ascobolus immersus RN42]|uniref:Peptide hydrolase n=1 Tax=Ascobolus immersus RN42 TaxID=1160509 RepID=A0A3N4IU97_ASCIM|nr:Zn-dependent exopeptidase [Ascobolus immersus RN42]